MTTEKKDAKGPAPPYVSYKTFKTFLRSLSQGIPSRIDKSVMQSLSGGVQVQITQTLKFFMLIDANGHTQQSLHALVSAVGGDNYATVLHNLMIQSYSFLKGHEDHLQTMTAYQLQEHFGTVVTGDTVQKCIAFFVPAAQDAGLKISTYITARKKRSPTNGGKKKSRPTTTTADEEAETDRQTKSSQPHDPKIQAQASWKQMLLDKFPTFDPSWPAEVQAKWFEGFNKLMEDGS